MYMLILLLLIFQPFVWHMRPPEKCRIAFETFKPFKIRVCQKNFSWRICNEDFLNWLSLLPLQVLHKSLPCIFDHHCNLFYFICHAGKLVCKIFMRKSIFSMSSVLSLLNLTSLGFYKRTIFFFIIVFVVKNIPLLSLPNW